MSKSLSLYEQLLLARAHYEAARSTLPPAAQVFVTGEAGKAVVRQLVALSGIGARIAYLERKLSPVVPFDRA